MNNDNSVYIACVGLIISLTGLAISWQLFNIRKDIHTITDRIEYVFPAPDTTSDTTTMFKETE
ncbi:hypothetical protein LCGC14_1581650 [marine sediment metagenome]|uniref:Uncharacterized protein n=1 Tax=marine sediment metagenome TaxID=412755 RepID=A0A0F9IGV4_9ZZZZ